MSSAPRRRNPRNQVYQRGGFNDVAVPCTCARQNQQVNRRPVQQQPVAVCKYFQTDDGCRNGDNCRFKHDLAPESGNYRTKSCRYFLRGECRNGDECTYRHDPPESNPNYRTKPCKYFQTEEGCRNGDKCRYRHEAAPEDAHEDAPEEAD